MKPIKSIILLLVCAATFAQEYTAAAKLSPIEYDLIYQIPLSPSFRSYSDVNPSGIRILDSNKGEVPYFIRREVGTSQQGFEKTNIISNTSADSVTSVVISNPGKDITLAIANSEVVKSYSVSGSNDQKKWYALQDSRLLSEVSNPDQFITYKTFSMPVNEYRYLRFDFDDRKTLPINIVAAGVLKNGFVPAVLQEVIGANVNISQHHDLKLTRIKMEFGSIRTVDRIALVINAPALYKREGNIVVRRSRKQRNKVTYYDEVVQRFHLRSGGVNSIDLSGFNESEFIIEIENEDNPPLDIDAVKLYQAPLYLIASLGAGQKYNIMAGDAYVPAASYDLINFKDKLPEELPTATISEVSSITTAKNKDAEGSPWIMWVCIAAGSVIVLYFSIGMVRDMKKEGPK